MRIDIVLAEIDAVWQNAKADCRTVRDVRRIHECVVAGGRRLRRVDRECEQEVSWLRGIHYDRLARLEVRGDRHGVARRFERNRSILPHGNWRAVRGGQLAAV